MIREMLFNIGIRGFNGVSDQLDASKQRALRGLYRNLRNPKTDTYHQNQRFLDALKINFPAEVVFYTESKREERKRVRDVEELTEALSEGPSTIFADVGYMIDINETIQDCDE